MNYFYYYNKSDHIYQKNWSRTFRIMKLTCLLLLTALLQINATAYSQATKFDMQLENITVKEVFKAIEAQSEFRFFYSDDLSFINQKISVDVNNVTVESILDHVLDHSDLTYRIFENNLIVVTPEGALQQGITITGTVSDNSGETLPGVNVMVKGTQIGNVTDVNGKYTITVPNREAVLVFTFVGYTGQETVVGNRQIIDLTLVENIQQIEEIVIVGYGQQRKVTLTGSVSQISGNDILSRPSANVTNSLQGMMAGVTVIRRSGLPGGEISGLRIRGFSSVNDVSAMVLIDGVEGSLENLNPDDIESLSVLKDASSASIYGARAAGGVILVTTKKGSAQKVTVTYNGSFGINSPGNMPQRMPPWEEQRFILDARYAAQDIWEFPDDFSEWLANPNYKIDIHRTAANRYEAAIGNSNWLYEGLHPYTTTQRHAVSLRGGHGRTTYFASGGYYTQNGLIKYGPDSNDRYNLRLNLDTEINKYLDFKLSVSFENNSVFANSAGNERIMQDLYVARGRESMYLPETDINYTKDPYGSDLWANPIRTMKFAGTDITNNNYFTGSGNLQIKNLVKGLTVDLNASRRYGMYSREIDQVYLPGQGRNGPRGDYNVNGPSSNVDKRKNSSFQDKVEGLINYRVKFNEHTIALLGGASYEHWNRDQITARAYGLLSDQLFSFNFYNSSDPINTSLSDAINEWKIASLFGRINYDYANRYLLEFVARYDGSSRLAPGNRFGFFPGMSAGWVVSEEKFFSGIKDYVNFLKLRGSFGQVGNSTVLNNMYYPYIGTIARANAWMGQPVYYRSTMTSKDVTWETLQTANVAADLSFFKHRLSLTGEYFWKKNLNMLSVMAPGNLVGVENLPRENVGTLKVWGWEILATWRDRIGDFRYNISFIIDDNNNKLIDYKGINTIAAGTVSLIEGYPMNTLWGYQTDGFWKSRDEYLAYKAAHPGYQSWQDSRIKGGDVRYVAQGNPDHTIGNTGSGTPNDPGDLIYLGDANIHFSYGLNLGVQWKNFDFSCFFQGVGKRSFFINNGVLPPLSAAQYMPWTIHKDYWREDNQDAYFARLFEGGSHNYYYSDRWVQNGAYIRLKNIQLGYNIPIKKYVQSLRVYMSGSDIWERTNMLNVFDPEYNADQGRNYYPFMRTWTMGVNLTF